MFLLSMTYLGVDAQDQFGRPEEGRENFIDLERPGTVQLMERGANKLKIAKFPDAA